MNKIQTTLTGAVVVGALAFGTPVLADQGEGMGHGFGQGMGIGMGMGIRHSHGHGKMDGADPSARVESHLSDMKAQLKITTAQEPAWQAFSAAAKQRAAGMQAMHTQMQHDSGNAADRMAQHSTMMQQRSAGMIATSDAFKALYAALTPEQKAVADQSFGKMAHRGKGAGHQHD